MSKDIKVYAELIELIDWLSGEELSEYEKGIITGLRIAEHIAEIIERHCEVEKIERKQHGQQKRL